MFSIAAEVRNTLGECPLWCERTRRLYWTDIEGSELLALEEDNDAVMRWSLPERLGSFALTGQGHILLMGLASRLAFYDLNTGLLTQVARSTTATQCRAKSSAAITPHCKTSTCSPKSKATGRPTAPAWMAWAIYGMLNGEGVVLSVIVRMEPQTLSCHPMEFRAPARHWPVRVSPASIAPRLLWVFLRHQFMMVPC